MKIFNFCVKLNCFILWDMCKYDRVWCGGGVVECAEDLLIICWPGCWCWGGPKHVNQIKPHNINLPHIGLFSVHILKINKTSQKKCAEDIRKI